MRGWIYTPNSDNLTANLCVALQDSAHVVFDVIYTYQRNHDQWRRRTFVREYFIGATYARGGSRLQR